MRNCIKYAQKCQNGFLRVGQQWYPINELNGSPLNIMYTLKYVESHNTDADKQVFTTLLLAGF